MSLKYPHLFEPIQLAGTFFKNRLFASPTGFQDLDGQGVLSEAAAAYYERKAMGGAASVAICEGIVDGELGRGGVYHICLDNPLVQHSLCRVAWAIKSQGAVASAELQHSGMYANRDLGMFGGGSRGFAYGPVAADLDGHEVRPMDEDTIARTIGKFADAAAFAKACGFGMVTVHAGHGWLLHQFLSPQLNTRTDKWGGAPIENRARLTVEVCKAIRKAVGPRFPIEIRISGSECYDGGYDIDEGVAFARQLDGIVDLIHVSAGSHEVDEVFSVTHPSMFLPDGCNVRFAAEIKKHVQTPVATVGALGDGALMEEIIASGKADVVEMARALLADPDLPIKLRAGRDGEVKKCMRCLSCFSSELSNGAPYCAINPETGRELEMKYGETPPKRRERVLVVGGGVAGMEAAIQCARRGHEVILCEKTGQLGGALRCERDVPFKTKLDDYLNQQARFVAEAGVDVRLNTAVTPEYASSVAPDAIIACLGARPVKPPIPGIDGANVMGAEEAYYAPDKVGQNVVILGAGLVGIELGLHLAMMGRKITIVEMLDHVSDGGNFLHMSGVRVQIKKYGLDIRLRTRAKAITAQGVVTESDGVEQTVPADTVIYAVGQRPLQQEAAALAPCAPAFYPIGDCVSPKNITNATALAYMAARNVGRV